MELSGNASMLVLIGLLSVPGGVLVMIGMLRGYNVSIWRNDRKKDSDG